MALPGRAVFGPDVLKEMHEAMQCVRGCGYDHLKACFVPSVLAAVCLPGFGGLNCTDKCGGTGDNATYGMAGRPMLLGEPTPCTSCSDKGKTVTYSFNW